MKKQTDKQQQATDPCKEKWQRRQVNKLHVSLDTAQISSRSDSLNLSSYQR